MDLVRVRLLRPDGTLVGTLPQNVTLTGLAFSPNSRHLAAMDWMNDGIKVYAVADRMREFVIPIWTHAGGQGERLSGLVWSPDGRFLAVTRPRGGVILCDVNRRLPVAKSSMAINSPIAFSPDSSTVIAKCADGKIRFWDLAEFR
jgi:WD40 repeat protein